MIATSDAPSGQQRAGDVGVVGEHRGADHQDEVGVLRASPRPGRSPAAGRPGSGDAPRGSRAGCRPWQARPRRAACTSRPARPPRPRRRRRRCRDPRPSPGSWPRRAARRARARPRGRRAARPVTERSSAAAVPAGSASASQSSIGIETNAGPARRQARVVDRLAERGGHVLGAGGSWLHLTNGWGTRMASRLVRLACIAITGRTCCPAVTTSGALSACALKIAPIALPRPGAVCRFTCVGRPDGLRVAVGHAHDHGLLEPEHVAEVAREVRQHRQLGGARVAEDRGHPVRPEEVEGRFADAGHGRASLSAPAVGSVLRWLRMRY